MQTTIRPFAVDELDTLALFAERLNAHRQTGSTFCCAKAADIRRDFAETLPYNFACWAENVPVGLLACYPDIEKQNADCSLLIEATGPDYERIAEGLVGAVRQRLGAGMACTFFFPAENAQCRHFLRRMGAAQQQNEYLLLLSQKDWQQSATLAAAAQPLTDPQRAAFAALHDAVFPHCYANGRDILAESGKTRFVHVITDGEGLAAYGVLKTQGGARATVEMLGVRPDARRRGYGRAMLRHLIQEAFCRHGARQVDLVVDADNHGALRLYLETGFAVQQQNNCFLLR